ncbi:MAG TPA: hypothetical protein PKA88_16235 [Polyangiaceae bacterium]|nr:hypothetical protein [Polyangiaceae bacterium]
MRCLAHIGLLSLTLTLACGSKVEGDPASGGAGGNGGSGASGASAATGGSGGSASCFVPDVSCPAERPFVGGACDTADVCQFEDPNKVDTWTYQCQAGAWVGEATCAPLLGGGCPVAPLVEKCTDPFDGQKSGAGLKIGPATPGAFREFQDGEEAPLTWGGQGSPMIGFRILATGADDVSCARVDTTASVNGLPGSHASAIKLHCGESLTVLTIVDAPCDPGVHSIELKVVVQGVGTATANLKLTDPACPG